MTALLTPKQVKERTGFEEKTLANWRSLTRTTGTAIGPPSLLIGRSVRYEEAELERWITESASRTK